MINRLILILTLLLSLLILLGCSNSQIKQTTGDTTEKVSTTANVTEAEIPKITTYPTYIPSADSYRFYTLDDFYLYAENFEQDISKYSVSPDILGDGLEYQLVENLFKIEEMFPAIADDKALVEYVNVGIYDYFYALSCDVWICFQRERTFPLNSGEYIVEPDSKLSTFERNEGLGYITQTTNSYLCGIEFQVAENLWAKIYLPIASDSRAEIINLDIPLISDLFSNDVTKVKETIEEIVVNSRLTP